MKVLLADSYGFCYGVKRVVDKLNELLDQHGKVYTYGQLIHNNQFTERMTQRGMRLINELSEIETLPKDAVVLTRAHGVLKDEMDSLQKSGRVIVDGTCPFVKAVHIKASVLENEGYTVLLIGDRNHPEVRSALSYMSDPIIVESPEDLNRPEIRERLSQVKRLGVVMQTTQSADNVSQIVKHLLDMSIDEIKLFNTRCNATEERQTAARRLAHKVDVMLVIGGKHSANTRRLYQLCSAITRSYHIETKDDIHKEWFYREDGSPVERVGITAGASTPDWVIRDVVDYLNSLSL